MRSKEPYSNLTVWQDSMEFIKEIYALTNVFPEEEKDGMVRRIRNSAIETVVNLSKFFTSKHVTSTLPSIQQAHDYISELEILLRIAESLNYISQEDIDNFSVKFEEMNRQLSLLIRKINREKEIESEES